MDKIIIIMVICFQKKVFDFRYRAIIVMTLLMSPTLMALFN